MLDIELFGGKRGLLEHVKARVLYGLGVYPRPSDIDWVGVRRLAFVCAGNICRSPYASAKARSLGVPAVSFGLRASDGAPADAQAARNALLRGVDLSDHRSMRAEASSFLDGDLIVVFEPWHLVEIFRLSTRELPVSLAGIWARPARPHIQDPYGRTDRYFQQCFSVIDDNIAAVIRNMPGHGDTKPGNERARLGANRFAKNSQRGTIL